MRRQTCVWILCLIACGGAQAKPTTTTESKPDPAPTPVAHDGPIELPQSASFGELIRTINQRPEREQESPATCLVETSSSFALQAPTAQAMRPLPPAPDDLDARFAAVPDPVRLLTLWGQVGVEADRLVAVTFTTTQATPSRPVFIALTDQGVLVRATDLTGAAMTRARALQKLRDKVGLERVIVTAEKNVPLRDLYSWLQELQTFTDLSVALAVMLPDGTRVPEPPAEEADELRCGEWENNATGDVRVDAVQAAISQATPTLSACLRREHGSRGGQITVLLGVTSTGEIDHGCISQGSLDSAASERCVVETLRALQLDAPAPAGSKATLMVPIVLRPKPELPVRPLCR